MTFAFPAFHEEILERDHTSDNIEAAMRRNGWKGIQKTATGIRCAVSFNLWSFGETIEVTCEDRRTVLRSNCILPTQCMDWGKNRRNITNLVAALER